MHLSNSLTLLGIKTLFQLIPIALEVSRFGSRNDDPVQTHMAEVTTPVVECVGAVEALKTAEVVKDVVDFPKMVAAALLRVDEVEIWHQEAEVSPKLRKTRSNTWPLLLPC